MTKALEGPAMKQEMPLRPKREQMNQFNTAMFTFYFVQYAEFKRYADQVESILAASRAELAKAAEELARVREENIRLLNDASVWRNRAIGAEEEIREGGRGIDLRRGFER